MARILVHVEGETEETFLIYCQSLKKMERQGRITVTVVPTFRALAMVIVPPCASTMLRQIDSPSPVPPVGRVREASTR